jgi:Na+-transporting methylmalonyl-CoA/oxaloacetate decarboxylase gamma subunit
VTVQRTIIGMGIGFVLLPVVYAISTVINRYVQSRKRYQLENPL